MFTEEMLKSIKQLHFVGIGGSGMFPLVEILHREGYTITGSDVNPGDNIDRERDMGITVTIGHNAENLGGAEAVVYSAAIPLSNVELTEAKKRGIPLIERAELFGLVSKRYDKCIAIAGTHGKTTTTSMASQMMLEGGYDPSVLIGGKLPLLNGSGKAGDSDYFVCEACEYNDTYLMLAPDYGVILNVDADHLEYFGSLDGVIHSFSKFAELCSKAVIVNGDDENAMKAVEGVSTPVVTFGSGDQNDFYPTDVKKITPMKTTFTLNSNGKALCEAEINVPGAHNVLNAVAALAACISAGAEADRLTAGLASYTGTGRRFEVLGTVNGVTVADDYAHHPKEVEAILSTVNGMGYKKVWAVFQPYTYTRTKEFLAEFADSLSIADRVVMSAIMGGRETDTLGITTEDLAVLTPDSVWFETFEEIAEYVSRNAEDGDLVLTMGCGDVYKCARMIKMCLESKA